MSQHTPGPWHARESYGWHWISAGRHTRATQIADVRKIPDADVTMANARLIAAAPDLLEACKAAFAVLAIAEIGGKSTANCRAAKDCEAAIAQATGSPVEGE